MNIELLRQLCETPGIPGREERVRALIESGEFAPSRAGEELVE